MKGKNGKYIHYMFLSELTYLVEACLELGTGTHGRAHDIVGLVGIWACSLEAAVVALLDLGDVMVLDEFQVLLLGCSQPRVLHEEGTIIVRPF